jgi:adenylate cyclase
MARRLAAIMFTDAVGSTEYAQRDEKAALSFLDEQHALAQPILAAHHGRLVKSTGDGMLIEFPNALDAVECGVALQQALRDRMGIKGVAPLLVRIGIHVGDIEERGTDILGDAVNVAARVEPLAEPGGLCVTGPVYDLVHNKVPFHMESIGSRSLRGVLERVAVYRVAVPTQRASIPQVRKGPPRIAVLPFANISPDPNDEYFADGLTEELVTVLSQIGELQVIGRASTLPYRSSPKSIPEIGSDLSAAWILEGSVRKAGDRLRITAQLVDVASQGHAWAETFDRKLDDIFEVQSEVARKVAGTLKIKVMGGVEQRLESPPLVNPDSYLSYLKGRSLLSNRSILGDQGLLEARKHFESAIALDPRNARAFAGLADALRFTLWREDVGYHAGVDTASREHAIRAVELDPNLAEAHCSLAMILWDDAEYRDAEREFARALSLNPSYDQAHAMYAALLEDEGRLEEALRERTLVEALDPGTLNNSVHRVVVLRWMGMLEEARAVTRRLGEKAPNSVAHLTALGWCRLSESDFEGAKRAWDAAEAQLPETEQEWIHLPLILALTGDRAGARAALEGLRQKGALFTHSPSHLASVVALLGDYDEAYRLLFEALNRHEPLALQNLRNEPLLASFREDGRFAEVLTRLNLV